jgi:hypothetical protein
MSFTLENFVKYQEQMVQKLKPLPDALGLMFAGSAADLSRVDQYSDQDFYLIVNNGTAESFRQNLSWLPRHEEIILSPRETAHGLKVLYRNGTMLEFAVFEIGELSTHLAPKDNRVVFDRGGVQEIIHDITHKQTNDFDPETEYQLFLTLLHIGIGRIKRGEIIAGSQHIKGYALNHLLGLIRHYEPANIDSSDALNRYRRFESDFPKLGAKLGTLVEGESLECAKGMIEIADSLPVSKKYDSGRDEVLKLLAP